MKKKMIEGTVTKVLNTHNASGHTMCSIVTDYCLSSNITKMVTLNIQSMKAGSVPPSVPNPDLVKTDKLHTKDVLSQRGGETRKSG